MTDRHLALDYGHVLLRDTLRCLECGSTLRYRTLAEVLLREIAHTSGRATVTVEDLSHSDVACSVLDTDSFSPISARLCRLPGYVRSKFLPDKPLGTELEPAVFNIDLQHIDFPSGKFDFILTSDVMEHVRDDAAAHREIWRCLKPGGAYIFTVPFVRNMLYTRQLVDASTRRDIFLCLPHLHGDPLSDGVLAYRIYGQELVSELEALGFIVRYEEISCATSAIFHGDIFLARKPFAAKPEQ